MTTGPAGGAPAGKARDFNRFGRLGWPDQLFDQAASFLRTATFFSSA
jgi:hypothetical protein